MSEEQQSIVCDPQTSGGLLVAVDEQGEADFLKIIKAEGMSLKCIGRLIEANTNDSLITVL